MATKNTEKQDTHYAKLRRNYRDNKPNEVKTDSIYLYGTHTVLSAINNKKRHIREILITQNSYKKFESILKVNSIKHNIVTTKDLSSLLDDQAIHQGIVAIAKPLTPKKLSDLSNSKIIVLLDQITDPHNVGAIMRSCVALNVDVLITTQRHSPKETSVLAKSASGAFDLLDFMIVKNLSETLQDLTDVGFTTIGLDSEGEFDLYEIYQQAKYEKIALVLGSEGKGFREKTKSTVSKLARLDMPGAIKSLNVSNAASIALYLTHKSFI